MEFLFLLWLVFALLTISVYTQRGHSAGYGALVGFMLGPAIGSVVTRNSVFAIFPTAAVLTALGIGVLWIAARQAA